MFGHKSFLRIGALEDSSIMGLYRDSYELDSCSFGFSQGVNSDGKPQTEVRGGSIYVTIAGIPPADIIQWALSSRKYNDGVIVICDDNDMPLEKIRFENAACISMEISYSQKGTSYTSTRLTLQAQKIAMEETQLENRWVGFNQ